MQFYTNETKCKWWRNRSWPLSHPSFPGSNVGIMDMSYYNERIHRSWAFHFPNPATEGSAPLRGGEINSPGTKLCNESFENWMPQREHFIAHFKTVICQILIGRIILKGAPGKEHVLSRQWKNNLGHKKLLSVSIIFLSFFCGHESEFLTAVTSFCHNRTRTVSETFHKPTKLMDPTYLCRYALSKTCSAET